MSLRSTVTPKKLAANRSNGSKSAGPATEEGKRQSKMNAFKHGRAAARPDPAALLLADSTEQEEAEREALRQETLSAYLADGQADDGFAAAEATELADLRFELARLERVRAVVWKRERELLELDEHRRRRLLQSPTITTTLEATRANGLLGLPDSPAKWRACVRELKLLAAQFFRGEFDASQHRLLALFGDKNLLWRGNQLWKLAERCHKHGEGADFDAASERLHVLVSDEIEEATESLELSEREQGPLSEAGQATRLLEAASSRKWNWIRQQGNFLRRSMDRKAKLLLELRAQHGKQAGRPAERPDHRPLPAPAPAHPLPDRAGMPGTRPSPAGRPAPDGSASARPPHAEFQKKVPKPQNEPTKSNGISEDVKSEPGLPPASGAAGAG